MGNSSSSSQTTGTTPSSSFDCEICTETVPPNKKFNHKRNCSHPFCVDCICHYIQVKVDDEKVADIKCPDIECGSSLEPITCRSVVGGSLFDRWCDVMLESLLIRSPKTFYCPYRECSALLWNECGGGDTRSRCPVCKKLFCFKCKLPWHSGFECNEGGMNRERNDVLFGVLVERNKWIRCPVCRHFVERVSGCSIVRCRCGVGFCYACGRKASHGHICRRFAGCSVNLLVLVPSITTFVLIVILMYIRIHITW